MKYVWIGLFFLISNAFWGVYLFLFGRCFILRYSPDQNFRHEILWRLWIGFVIHLFLSIAIGYVYSTWRIPVGEPSWHDRFELALPEASLVFGVCLNTILIFRMKDPPYGWTGDSRWFPGPIQLLALLFPPLALFLAFETLGALSQPLPNDYRDDGFDKFLAAIFLISIWLLFKQARLWTSRFQPDPKADRIRNTISIAYGALALTWSVFGVFSTPNY